MTQNGHFFPKNVEKISDKNSENCVLLCENPFYEKWQSGRINFFWGGFSAFMVYALTLISDGPLTICTCIGIPYASTNSKCPIRFKVIKNNYNIYRRYSDYT